jgi:Uma2 family endonuclease
MTPSHDLQARIDRYATAILRDGPTRVLISQDAQATTPRRAREEHNITPDVIFIRNDGWSLGAPARYESIARALWRDDWIGFIRRPNTRAEPYQEEDHGDLRI